MSNIGKKLSRYLEKAPSKKLDNFIMNEIDCVAGPNKATKNSWKYMLAPIFGLCIIFVLKGSGSLTQEKNIEQYTQILDTIDLIDDEIYEEDSFLDEV